MDDEEWNDWMGREGAEVKTDSSILGQKNAFESTLSTFDAASVETSPFSVCSTETTFAFEDSLFDFDESTDYSQSLPTSQIPQDLRRPMYRNPSLTATERQRLQDITMPYGWLLQAKILPEPSSPTTSRYSQSRFPSPESETYKRKNKKKLLIDNDNMPDRLCQSKKRGHNAIEKRYRTNLNDKIASLCQGIPPLWRNSSTDSKSCNKGKDLDYKASDKKPRQQKYGKAAILTRALEYIQYLESTNERLGDEAMDSKTRIIAFERLAMNGNSMMNGIAMSTGLPIPKKETLQSIQADMFFLDSLFRISS